MIGRRGRPGLIGLAARTAVVAGTANALSNASANSAQQKAQGQAAIAQQQAAAQQAVAQQLAAAAPAAAAPAAGIDIVAELQKLATLKESGLLDDAEFAAAKAKLLG